MLFSELALVSNHTGFALECGERLLQRLQLLAVRVALLQRFYHSQEVVFCKQPEKPCCRPGN